MPGRDQVTSKLLYWHAPYQQTNSVSDPAKIWPGCQTDLRSAVHQHPRLSSSRLPNGQTGHHTCFLLVLIVIIIIIIIIIIVIIITSVQWAVLVECTSYMLPTYLNHHHCMQSTEWARMSLQCLLDYHYHHHLLHHHHHHHIWRHWRVNVSPVWVGW